MSFHGGPGNNGQQDYRYDQRNDRNNFPNFHEENKYDRYNNNQYDN